MKSIRRHMCHVRLNRALTVRLNKMDQRQAFGIRYGDSIRLSIPTAERIGGVRG